MSMPGRSWSCDCCLSSARRNGGEKRSGHKKKQHYIAGPKAVDIQEMECALIYLSAVHPCCQSFKSPVQLLTYFSLFFSSLFLSVMGFTFFLRISGHANWHFAFAK